MIQHAPAGLLSTESETLIFFVITPIILQSLRLTVVFWDDKNTAVHPMWFILFRIWNWFQEDTWWTFQSYSVNWFRRRNHTDLIPLWQSSFLCFHQSIWDNKTYSVLCLIQRILMKALVTKLTNCGVKIKLTEMQN